MKLRGPLFALSLIIIGYVSIQASPLNAQSLTVSGTVTSADNEQPLVGVNILVQGTDQGTTTDDGGNYTIGLDDPSATLVFSYIGYATKEIPVDKVLSAVREEGFSIQDLTTKESDLEGWLWLEV